MPIDTEVRHVTKAGSNLFLELGFAKEVAAKLQAKSDQEIHDAYSEKASLIEDSQLSSKHPAIAKSDAPQRT